MSKKLINLTIEGIKVQAEEGSTILEAARANGITIPTLCYLKDLNPIGACRMCLVEVTGARGLVAACVYPVAEGMEVRVNTKKTFDARKKNLELLMSNHRKDCSNCLKSHFCKLREYAEVYMKMKLMKDTLGTIKVPGNVFWGAQTQRSKQNFTISDEKMPKQLIKCITYIKKACAIANAKVGKLDNAKKAAIVKVCDEILAGKLANNFPLSIWQTGSGTQTNMNVNEVVAYRANYEAKKEKFIHPNDHVNMSQSSNDVFPTAMHLVIATLTKEKLLPNLEKLIKELKVLVKKTWKIIKVGRTHLQDATPVRLGQEISAWVAMLENSRDMILDANKYINQLCIGGTAVGTGLNTPKNFDKMVCAELSKMIGIKFSALPNKFQGLSSKDSVSHYHAALKTLAESLIKIANDVRFLASGPNCGIGEIIIPSNEPGSSIMPGKVNPTQCEAMMMLCIRVIGNDACVTLGNAMGNYQLNTFMPMMIYSINQSINLLADGMDSFTRKCVMGIKPNLKKIEYNLYRDLMLVTALNVKIGYEKAADISKLAQKESITLKEAARKLGYLSDKEFDKIVIPSKMVG